VKHATLATIDALEPLRTQIRAIDGLAERKPGLFAKGGRAYLHFHEDPDGIYADVRAGDDWDRYRVSTVAERRVLLRALKQGAVLRVSDESSGARGAIR
jgi:hypothetical protein